MYVQVSSFVPSLLNWVHPLSHPKESVAPPPFGSKGRHTLLRGRGWGIQFRRRDTDQTQTLWYSRYAIIPLCILTYHNTKTSSYKLMDVFARTYHVRIYNTASKARLGCSLILPTFLWLSTSNRSN